MEANERKVSTRVQGAAWRRRDAPTARGVSFWERHGGDEEEMRGAEQETREKRKEQKDERRNREMNGSER